MKIRKKRTYCHDCLERVGILNADETLQFLEDKGTFPCRIGPQRWDADQIDKWFKCVTGLRPPKVKCKC